MKAKTYAEKRLETAHASVLRQMSLMFALTLYERDHGKPAEKDFRPINPEMLCHSCDNWSKKGQIAGVIIFAFVASCGGIVWSVGRLDQSNGILIPSAIGLLISLILAVFHIGYSMRRGGPSKAQRAIADEWQPWRDIAEESGVVNVAALILCESKVPGAFDKARATADVSVHLKGVILSILISKMRDQRRLILNSHSVKPGMYTGYAVDDLGHLEQLAESLGFVAPDYMESEEDPAALIV